MISLFIFSSKIANHNKSVGLMDRKRLLKNKVQILRGDKKNEDRLVRKDKTILAMLDSVHRDVEDARAAIKGSHRPEATERMKHMFDVVDQMENVLAEI